MVGLPEGKSLRISLAVSICRTIYERVRQIDEQPATQCDI